MALAITLIVATFYTAADYPGDVYCRDATMTELQAAGIRFVAVDVDWYTSGRVRCGDLLAITFPGGQVLRARALDAGPLGRYQVRGMGQIGMDVPQHLWPAEGRAAVVTMRNVTADLRRRIPQ